MENHLESQKINDIDPEIFQSIMLYKTSVESVKEKSQDDFEKYIHLLASGGLIVSLLALDKIMNVIEQPTFKLFFVLGLFSFVASLLSTLLSHKRSIKESEKIINQINVEPACIFNQEFTTSLSNGNRKIENFNKISIGSLIFGIGMILIFFSINFLNMSNDKPNPQKPETSNPKPLTEEKGRTIAHPPKAPTPNKR